MNVYYRFWNGHVLHFMARGNFRTGRGGVGLSYGFPIPNSERSCLFFRLTHGYGESLVDYKRSLTRVGVGIMFVSAGGAPSTERTAELWGTHLPILPPNPQQAVGYPEFFNRAHR